VASALALATPTASEAQLAALHHTYNSPTPALRSEFGFRVALVGDDVLVGSALGSSVHLFDGETGALTRTFQKASPDPGDLFGFSVAAAGQNALVGATLDDTGGANAGAVYLFDAATGEILQTFLNPTPAENDEFGLAIASAGGNVLVGAPGDDTGATDAGAVYLFGPPVVTLGANKGFKGSKTLVPISLNDASNVLAGLFKITYDPTKLTLESNDVSATSLTSGFLIAADVLQSDGKAAVTVAGGTGVAAGQSGALASVAFQVLNTADVSVGDVLDLTVTEATLILDDGDLVTLSPEVRPGSLEVLLRGDMNANQDIDLMDLGTILRLALNLVPNPTPLQLAQADADENGLVTIDDALLVIRDLTSAAKPVGIPQPVRLDIASRYGRSGLPVSIPVEIAGGQFARGLDVEIRYDPAALHLEGITPSGAANALAHDTSARGTIRLMGVSPSGFADGSLADLRFTARVSGVVDLRIGTARAFGPTADPLPLQITRGGEPPPAVFRLRRNAPNPFNPATVVGYDLPAAADVRIEVFNALGQHVETLLLAHQQAGRHQITWNADGAASGLYHLVVEAGGSRESIKMLLLK
jgi:hypothetical protein